MLISHPWNTFWMVTRAVGLPHEFARLWTPEKTNISPLTRVWTIVIRVINQHRFVCIEVSRSWPSASESSAVPCCPDMPQPAGKQGVDNQNLVFCNCSPSIQTYQFDIHDLIPGWWFVTFFLFPNTWEFHHPNWLSYFSEGLKPPTRWCV